MGERTGLVVVGGGIVGLATAYQWLSSYPGSRLIVLEKEAEVAAHQTGHNSGVIHSGIYYKPGSLKARTCRAGKAELEQFCQDQGIRFEICGKVIVAVDESELPALERIHERGVANGVSCELIDGDRLRDLEPEAAGIQALHVHESGIVDYSEVCRALARQIQSLGGEVRTSTEVLGISQTQHGVYVETSDRDVEARGLVNCAGLQSDRVTALSGQRPNVKIVPFRGEYYELKPEAHGLVRNLIYPVPDPSFPFLGVHFTRMIDGRVECGPNAVLAYAREGYHKTDLNFGDLAETLSYPGFLKIATKFWRMGLGEMHRSLSKAAFVRALQRLLPAIRAEHLVDAPAGIRAQAIGPDGSMVDDFLIQENGPIVNVCNAPSPAATACLAIGRQIVERLTARIPIHVPRSVGMNPGRVSLQDVENQQGKLAESMISA